MTRDSDPARSIVLIDDELHNVGWLQDYLESKKFNVITAETLNEALEIIESARYRAIVVDLNIPAVGHLPPLLAEMGPPYPVFPGLYVAFRARTLGYRDRQIILYTVHRESEVARMADRMGVTYILKGRPLEIKREIDSVISFDPTSQRK